MNRLSWEDFITLHSILASLYQDIPREGLLEAFPQGVVFFDLETTGLSPIQDKIIEIGAIKLTAEGNWEFFQEFVNPLIPISAISQTIHHISDQMVTNKDSLELVLPRFMQFVGDLSLVAQNARFDIGFLVFGLYQYHLTIPSMRIYDSAQMARKMFPDFKRYGLQHLCQKLNILSSQFHRALEDSVACLKVVHACLIEAKTKEITAQKLRTHSLLFSFDEFKNIDLDIPNLLKPLLGHISEQCPFEIEYKSKSFKGQFRPIRPSALIPLPRGVVLYAYCFFSQSYKSFGVKKIKAARPMMETDQQKWKDKYAEQWSKYEASTQQAS
jgi:DNA polymerase-3 subunit epsilon